jgi:hypothetical protein
MPSSSTMKRTLLTTLSKTRTVHSKLTALLLTDCFTDRIIRARQTAAHQ